MKIFGKLCFESTKMNENSETGYIFRTKNLMLAEDKRIWWAPPCQVEAKCPPPPSAFVLIFFLLK